MSHSEEISLPIPHNAEDCEIFKRFNLKKSRENHPFDSLAIVHSYFAPPLSPDLWPKTIGDIGDDEIKIFLDVAGPDAVGSKLPPDSFSNF